MKEGGLVIFSGLDGSGKSTQIDLLRNRMIAEGLNPISLWTRVGYTSLFNLLKKGVRRVGSKAVPPPGRTPERERAFSRSWIRRLWIILALLDLIRVYGVMIRYWRWIGRPVICDRFLLDSLVDFKLNFPRDEVDRWFLWKFLVKITPKPDRSFLMLIPVEESIRRSEVKKEPFPDSPATLESRLNHYRALGPAMGYLVLDGVRPPADLFQEILGHLNGLMGEGAPIPSGR